MGVTFVKGKIGTISEKENGNLILRYEDISEGVVREAEHDMVVLSVGVKSNPDAGKIFPQGALKLDPYRFVAQSDLLGSPSKPASTASLLPALLLHPWISPTRSSRQVLHHQKPSVI